MPEFHRRWVWSRDDLEGRVYGDPLLPIDHDRVDYWREFPGWRLRLGNAGGRLLGWAIYDPVADAITRVTDERFRPDLERLRPLLRKEVERRRAAGRE